MTNVTFENFRSLGSLYGLDINQYWQNTFTPDTGSVALSNLLFKNFSGKSLRWLEKIGKLTPTGSVANGALRPPLYLIANDLTFAKNVTVEDFSIWTETGTNVVNHISNVFGKGDNSYGTNDGIPSLSAGQAPYTYTSAYTITASPTSWKAPSTPTWAVASTGYGSKFLLSFLGRFTFDADLLLRIAASPIPVYTPAPLWRPGGVDYDLHYWGSF